MNHGLYTLKDYLTENNLYQILIPEIQRDYVWEKKNVLNLLESIAENAGKTLENNLTITDDILNKMPSKIKDTLLKLDQSRVSTNIGFIYAYSDEQIHGQYILIDGQQRLTTVFLLLLCLAIKEKKIPKFKQSYFFDNILKIDYKVRESSHDFLYSFVDFLLGGNYLNNLDNQYWYSREYENDLTIGSIKRNYQCIQDYLNDNNDITYDYVENNIEFWYFDTDLSMQGEELYLYMNSRGEAVTQTESIKARLIKKLDSEKEKHSWGKKWEFWQDFFWKNRNNNANSDIGMEEFLKWITIIEKIKTSGEVAVEKVSNDIRVLWGENEINIKYLNFNIIDQYFKAIEKFKHSKLINDKYLYFKDDDVFSKKQNAISYFRLLPVIIYLVYHKDATFISTLRYGRFFSNLSKNKDISKASYQSVVYAVRMTFEFLDRNYFDVIDLLDFVGKYNFLLTREETAKLEIFKNNLDIREDIERSFWNAEDNYFCNGSLGFLFRCMKYDIDHKTFSKSALEKFDSVLSGFSTLLDDCDDLLRRALLTKGDYKVEKTYSYYYEGIKYSFLYSKEDWKEELISVHRPLLDCFEKLLNDYIEYKKLNSAGTRTEFLGDIIQNYDIKNSKYKWINHFVKIPKVLSLCGNKLACFKPADFSDIILLSRKKPSNYDAKLLDIVKEFNESCDL